MATLQIFRNNTIPISCTISGVTDSSTYIPWFTLKDKTLKNTALTIDGSVSNDIALFNLTPNDTSMAAGDYAYDITLIKGDVTYTIVKDKAIVVETVK